MARLNSDFPVAVIGAGPVGLAAAAHLAERKLPFIVFESGDTPAAAMRQWKHVTLFSPWRYNVDHAAARLLEATGWKRPDNNRDPVAIELIDTYLSPLAALPQLAPHIRYGTKVIAVTRQGMDRVPSKGRSIRPFEITSVLSDGTVDRVLAGAVIDASGVWSTPNPAGANGRQAIGEDQKNGNIATGLPDVLRSMRSRYAGKHTVVIGAGHSAMDSILNLAQLKTEVPGTRITWAMRSPPLAKKFGGGSNDQLAERGALGARAKSLVENGSVSLVAPFRTTEFARHGDKTIIRDEAGQTLEADEVIVATGFRPDFSMLSEIRLDLHPWLESAKELGPLIDPNEHSCGDVPPHGVEELTQPEENFFIVGMKSYGRAPTFLMATGYEQVRSVVAALAGDMEAALKTELDLPQTGVCEGIGRPDGAGFCESPTPTCTDAACVTDVQAIKKPEAGCRVSGACA